jgi:hypothetical protein
LLASLHLTGKVEGDFFVVKRLRELSLTMPNKSIECLSLMIDGDEKGWGMLGWREDAYRILEGGMVSKDPNTIRGASALIHKLGGLGYFEFGKLLELDAS